MAPAVQDYAEFDQFRFERAGQFVLRVTIATGLRGNAVGAEMHHQFVRLLKAVDADPLVRAMIITGEGRAFCAGAAMDEAKAAASEAPFADFLATFREARELVNAMIEMRKPIISAINGPAAGVGLAIALLSDIPIAAETAKLVDGHLNIGVVPGDHAALIWPLLCGLAKAKYFLMANEVVTGRDAERCNLVALAVPAEDLAARALAVAERCAAAAPGAQQMTKYVLNHHLRRNAAIFDLSAAIEMAGLQGEESREAIDALRTGRTPDFRS